MTITKLGIYKTRGGVEARVAVLQGWLAWGYITSAPNSILGTMSAEWFGDGSRISSARTTAHDLVELIQVWPEGKHGTE